jgi:hypothetical protein
MDAGIGEAALLSTLAAEGGSAAIGAGALGAGEMAGIAGLTGLGELGGLSALGEGTAMGMLPEAAAIPGASAFTPTLQAAAPEAFTQGMNALQSSGTPNFASMMSGPSVNMAGLGTDATALNSLDLAEGANYGGSGFSQFPGAGTEGIGSLANASMFPSESDLAYSELAQKQALQNMEGNQGFGLKDLASAYNAIPKELRYAGIGYSALQALNADKNRYGTPAQEKYSGPLSKFQYDPGRFTPTTTPQPTPYTPTRYAYAEGGIASLGGYSDGGRMLKGPGDGMIDSIPATISNKQPARLADGEFVVPADVVSHLGNGSTDAGAKQLYKMMDKVRVARTGKKTQGRQINPRKYVLA